MFKGIIFDMDGVISDTQKLHSLAECELLNRHGIDITPEEITRKYAGVRTKEFFDVLLGQSGQEYDLEELIKEKWINEEKYFLFLCRKILNTNHIYPRIKNISAMLRK